MTIMNETFLENDGGENVQYHQCPGYFEETGTKIFAQDGHTYYKTTEKVTIIVFLSSCGFVYVHLRERNERFYFNHSIDQMNNFSCNLAVETQ